MMFKSDSFSDLNPSLSYGHSVTRCGRNMDMLLVYGGEIAAGSMQAALNIVLHEGCLTRLMLLLSWVIINYPLPWTEYLHPSQAL